MEYELIRTVLSLFYFSLFGLFLIWITVTTTIRSVKLTRKTRQQYLDLIEEQLERASMEIHDSMSSSGIELDIIISKSSLTDYEKKRFHDVLSRLKVDVSIANESIYPRGLLLDDFKSSLEDLFKFITDQEVEFEFESDQIDQMPTEHQIHLYRIVQEILANAVRHESGQLFSVYIHDVDQEINIHISYQGKQKSKSELLKNKISKGKFVALSRCKRIKAKLKHRTGQDGFSTYNINVHL